MAVRWRSDFDKHVVVSNLRRRGWEEVTCVLDEDWDIYWASVQTAKSIFGPDSGVRLQPGQLVNHFPNHYELTRKDLMVKNIKRYQRQLRREPGHAEEPDIIPATFVLPQDYALFVEEYRKAPNTTWIMKPSSKSQGKGIFLINKLSQVKRWSNAALPPALRNGADNYVVSRYIDNPLLIGGKKFDMRLYVVVTSFKPMQVYLSRLGFGRFCNVKYTPGADELDNEFVHLTNVAIQKHGSDYNDKHGNKWTLDNVRLYLEATRGPEQTQQLFKEIEEVIVKSLKACQNTIINDRHCFELYGYDIIVDDTLRPWLIEVNASPSLTTTTQSDRLLKFKVINDALNIVTPLDWLPLTQETGAPADQLPSFHRVGRRERVGSFHLIYDEEHEAERASTASSSRARSEEPRPRSGSAYLPPQRQQGPGGEGARRAGSARRAPYLA